MKKSLKSTALVLAIVSLFIGCKKDEAVPEFEQENALYTGQFNFRPKSQQFTLNSDGKNIIRVVVEGAGSLSFAGNVTFVDEFDFVLATGAANHKLTATTSTGDKLYTTMTTQAGQSSITGTTTFTGGTGRFAKIKGGSPNTGPLPGATGEGSWKEEGGRVTF
ncbi:hypothetical protein [Spirosoma areae]